MGVIWNLRKMCPCFILKIDLYLVRPPSSKMSEREFVVGPWRKFVIGKNTDMSEEMQQYAVDCAKQALEKYNNGEDFDDVADIANFIGKAFDKKYNPTWAWSL